MDVKKAVMDYWNANNPVLCLCTEEVYQTQTAVEQAVSDLNAGHKSAAEHILMTMHDPLAGFHFGEFRVSDRPLPATACLSDLVRFLEGSIPEKEFPGAVGFQQAARGQSLGLEATDNAVIVLKGWETLWDDREQESPNIVQAFTNILQGGLCSPVRDDDKVTRGRRMIIILTKNSVMPTAMTEVRAIHVPLPVREDFIPLLEPKWEAAVSQDKLNGCDDAFKAKVLGGLVGMTIKAADDALALAMVENAGFANPGTLNTLERIKALSIEAIPGLQYVPGSQVESGAAILPGYEKIQEDLLDAVGLDAEWAKRHRTKPLKGILLAGPPGCGKTVAELQITRILGKAALLWSIGESQGSLVSESERNTRRVINIANALEAVLVLDDIDKAGAGASSSSTTTDGGVFSRMINIILTEMSNPECKITWLFSANRLQDVRPELYRDGRVDERYFVDYPDAEMRRRIIEFHMAKHNFPVDAFHAKGSASVKGYMDTLVNDATKGWSGAELEGLVVKTIRHAGRTGEEKLDISWMLDRAKGKTPQSMAKASAADIAQMRDLCGDFIAVGVTNSGKSVRLTERTREINMGA